MTNSVGLALLFCSHQGQLLLKISDFGLAQSVRSSLIGHSYGTDAYRPPEVLAVAYNEGDPSEIDGGLADAWAFGGLRAAAISARDGDGGDEVGGGGLRARGVNEDEPTNEPERLRRGGIG